MRLVFGDCELDPGRRQLLRHGAVRPLSPRAFELLSLLLDRRPEAISKTELLSLLWPGTFVSDGSLHNVMAEIRAALADSPRAPRYIRTVARYGYAFHGEVREAQDTRTRVSAPGPRLSTRTHEWPLVEGANLMGRDQTCAICIDSEKISRRHARIVVTNGDAVIEDLGSKNGTYVDGRRIERPVQLVENAKIRIGAVTATYRGGDPLLSTLTERRK